MRVLVQATEATTEALIKGGNVSWFGGSGVAIFGWLNATEWAAVGGFLVGAGGLLVSAYFNRRRDQREQAEHENRMKRWSLGLESDKAPLGKR